jgi:transposase
MSKDSRIEARLTIGVDLGDRYSQVCVLDEWGEVTERARLVTSSAAFGRRFGSCEPARVAIEVGTHSPWVRRLLEECGHEVLVANPRKLRSVYDNDSKADPVDAEMLARLARVDPKLLAPIRHRGVDFQADLAVLRSRAALVRARTLLVNHARGAVKSFGGRLTKCSTQSFHKSAPAQIPEELKPALGPVMSTIASLTAEIRGYDRQIEAMARERYPETRLLQQVSGVGVLTATAYVLTIEDPHRFERSRCVGPYLGLRPKRAQTGGRDPELRITKAGDGDLRRLLVGAAHYILGPFGPDSDLRRWGLALATRGRKNAKKRAVVAVARKLAVLLHRLWLTGEVYEPLRNTTAREKKRSGRARHKAA